MSASARGVRLRVSAEVQALTRAETIARIAYEDSEAVGATSGELEIILDGFRDALLTEVEFLLFESASEDSYLGYLSIECDWEKHQILLREGRAKKAFEIDLSKPLAGQLSESLERAIAFIVEKCDEIGVHRRDVIFTLNPERKEEFRARFGTGPISDEQAAVLRRARVDKQLGFSPAVCEEMNLSFGYREKPSG